MTGNAATSDLARQVRAMFDVNPDLTLQLYAPARLGVFGVKANKSKTIGLYHLADGEVGYNLDEARPLGKALKKALDEQGFSKRIANAAVLGLRQGQDVVVRIVIVAAGDVQAGEHIVRDAQTEEEYAKRLPVPYYRLPRPVGTMIDIDASGVATVTKEASPATHWDETPIPWGDLSVDLSIRHQVADAVRMDVPTIASIRKFGELRRKA